MVLTARKEFPLLARSTHRACDGSFNSSGAMPTLAHVNVFQPDDAFNIGFRDINFGLATVADAAGIRPQSCRLGEGDSWVAVTNQRLSHRAVGADLLRPPV